MRFIDEVTVHVVSGSGGNGCVSFRREKFVPRGGPDGGDGGRGGAVIFEASRSRNTLIDLRRRPRLKAARGDHGSGSQMNGAFGVDFRCEVPIGTLIYDQASGKLLADLDAAGMTWQVPGGEGGRGNPHFRSSRNRTPRKATDGKPGQDRKLRLELKLLADVGLIGLPNAGKSTFLSRVSSARPKVADYPFTTLVPQLGVVRLGSGESFVLADIPGLIEGAAEGAGLGHRFLKHVERCRVHVHLVSAEGAETPTERLRVLNEELRRYSSSLARTPQVVALNKVDLLDAEERKSLIEALSKASGSRVFGVSAITGEGMPQLIGALWTGLGQLRAQKADDAPSE
jgi:GTP-binding protein